MERKDFVLILVAIIIISGGYYLYTNNVWPFGNSGDVAIPSAIAEQVYAVSGVAKEVYDTVVIMETSQPKNKGGMGELMAVINDNTSIFTFNAVSPDQIDRIKLSIADIKVGDRIALTSDDDIALKKNGVFLASSIAIYR